MPIEIQDVELMGTPSPPSAPASPTPSPAPPSAGPDPGFDEWWRRYCERADRLRAD